jgi:hypothetical protein
MRMAEKDGLVWKIGALTAERGLETSSPTGAHALCCEGTSAVGIVASPKCCCTWNCAGGRPALANKNNWQTIDNLYI